MKADGPCSSPSTANARLAAVASPEARAADAATSAANASSHGPSGTVSLAITMPPTTRAISPCQPPRTDLSVQRRSGPSSRSATVLPAFPVNRSPSDRSDSRSSTAAGEARRAPSARRSRNAPGSSLIDRP